jgi:hypothetical protein
MAQAFDYGPCLSDEEYDRKIIELYRGLPPLPTEEQDREVRRRELELLIDHRLGRGFPKDRRRALFAVQQRLEKQHLGSTVRYFLGKLLPKFVSRHARFLAGDTANAYARVLSKAELMRFLDLREDEIPVLPVDIESLGK